MHYQVVSRFAGINRSLSTGFGALLFTLALVNRFALMAGTADILPPGHRPHGLGLHALVGGRIVIKPGQVLERGTILIRDGLIEAVGPNPLVPPEARIWAMDGQTIYAGFIEPYYVTTLTNRPVRHDASEPEDLGFGSVNFFGVPGENEAAAKLPGYEVPSVHPQNRVVLSYQPPAEVLDSLRELGFTAANVVPAKGVIRGTSVFTLLANARPNETVLKPDTFQHIAFEPQTGPASKYPASLMGVIAVIRQTFLDAEYYETQTTTNSPPGRSRLEFNPALESLRSVRARKLPVVLESGNVLMVERAAALAREVGFEAVILASGQEWRRPELVQSAGLPFIVPVNYPDLPRISDDDDWVQLNLDQLRIWDWAPENPAVIRRQGVDLAFTTYGLSDKKNFRKNLRLSLARGLSEEDSTAALTTIPAKLCGLQNLLGTIEPGKMANLTVVKGKSFFESNSKVSEVWIEGKLYRVELEPGKPREGETNRMEVARSPEEGDPARRPKPAAEPKSDTASVSAGSKPDPVPGAKKAGDSELFDQLGKRLAKHPWEGEGKGILAEPESILIRGATLWTCGPGGVIPAGDLWIVGSKIAGIGPAGTNFQRSTGRSPLIIDGHGLHVTPGLIDAHSHSMILGAVNEATLPSTAMVRVEDVINSETANIYQQLAGGLTMANLLHGSANPIGGQNCVIKLKNGALPAQLKFTNAPPGIKFALGENVKQSNWGERNTSRFPQTRMGVPTFLENRFQAARSYSHQWETYGRTGGPRPRRNLELEALVEILEGKRLIHCHSYRQDEILVFLRLMEQLGIKVGTLQHVLDGYKVADEIASHGAGASTFSDWWAYKFEVWDAIPYNGSLMRDRKVLVSFNSDSSDLARRLHLEAAKAVKYGKTPEEEALKFVTHNPARQLHVQDQVGSLEPGKDADFVIWSHSPLDSRTICLQTWIEGKKYFERSREPARSAALGLERKALLDKARKVMRLTDKPAGNLESPASTFQEVLRHCDDGKDRSCLDD